MKSPNEIAAEFLQHPDQPFETKLNGERCTINLALRALREGQMFENGNVESGGNEYWFSGTLDGEAFVFSILGDGIGTKLAKLNYAQFPVKA